ncbi:Coronin-7 [Desmophyllum pertusum]|uniref:Coronin n=1 Tax=Desmophyllum pertusum TaxID=174260 RepID=A0A9W9YM41_9CNID|nr:Coronin-7 [Desmophyllum pertusum]
MNRFRTSKYRNAAPKIPKKEECVTDIKVGNLKSSYGNHIKASDSFMAFNVDAGGGGSLGILPLGDVGRKEQSLPMLHAHSDFVTDVDFSPFDGRLLSTCSYDCSIKLWQIPEEGITAPVSSPLCVLPQQPGRVENVLFHPSASEVLGSSCGKSLTIWDLQNQQQKYNLDNHQDLVQSFCWKGDGSLLVTSSKDKKVRILDPRSSSVVVECDGIGGIKDSRVLWLGSTDRILGTGFNKSRAREIVVWDVNNMSNPVQRITLDTSSGILMPFFDPDTNMLFLAGKGDSVIQYLEVSDTAASFVTQVSSQLLEEQHKGMGIVPKLAMDVMACEVVCLLQLTKSSVVPLSYRVPRKSYKEFHEDLFPDTVAREASMTGDEWFSGSNSPMKRVSLNPSKRQTQQKTQLEKPEKPTMKPKPTIEAQKPSVSPAKSTAEPKESPTETTSNVTQQTTPASEPATESPAKPKKTFTGVRTSKFRHLHGTPMHKSNNFDNVRNLSISMPGDCDGFHVNQDFAAFPLSGPGGQIAVVPLNEPCRLPDSGLPVIQCGSGVMDYAMDPFNRKRLATACESGFVSIWEVPDGGLTEIINNPSVVLKGHDDKPNIVKYHPTANGVLASSSLDLTVKIWDISKAKDLITLNGHTEQVFSLSWKTDGTKLATVSRDNKVRIFDPRSQVSPLQTGPGPEGTRGARVVWGGPGGDWLVVSGFGRMSTRTISVYDSRNLSEVLSTVETNVAPATLIPFYDEDSSVVFLSAKGETTIFAYEISEEPPHIFELSNYRIKEPYQAVAFLPKTVCDIKEVEFARAVKLNKTSIELIMFQVPRVKMEYFQDDLFPDTTVSWEPALTSDQWFAGENGTQRKLSLRPDGMKALSEVPKEAPIAKKYDSRHELDEWKSSEQKKEELLSSMVEKLRNYDDDPLPQDLQEGVDDDEWSD